MFTLIELLQENAGYAFSTSQTSFTALMNLNSEHSTAVGMNSPHHAANGVSSPATTCSHLRNSLSMTYHVSDLAPVLVPSKENLMPNDSCHGNYSARGKTESANGLCALSEHRTAALGNLGTT